MLGSYRGVRRWGVCCSSSAFVCASVWRSLIMSDKANLIVNGVLCYISSARCTYTDQTLLSICQSFYKCDKVVEAKKILFGATGEAVSQRRGEGRLRAELTDILDEFRKADENGVVLPAFVADSFASMPPASGFEVLSEHLISLLAEISNLKQQVTSLTESVDGIKDCNVTDIKEDLYDIKTVLFRNNTQSTQPLLYSTVTASSLSHDNSKKNKETVENSNKKIDRNKDEAQVGVFVTSLRSKRMLLVDPLFTQTLEQPAAVHLLAAKRNNGRFREATERSKTSLLVKRKVFEILGLHVKH